MIRQPHPVVLFSLLFCFAPQHRGISPRALAHIFQEVNARIETAFNVTITYIEIYNEKIFDLLVDPAVDATKVR